MVGLFLVIEIFGGIFFGAWWCLKQYYYARKKGYHALLAATIVLGTIFLQISVVVTLIAFFIDVEWSDAATTVAGFLLFVGPPLLATAVVGILPPRSRRTGPRRSPILSSAIGRVLENGLAIIAGIGCIVGLTIFINAVPDSGLSGLGRIVMWSMTIPAICATVLHFARAQLDTPGLPEVITADTRPAVLYVRAFQYELEPFAYVPSIESVQYTSFGMPVPTVTFEQYLSAEFVKQIGPFIALGNPFDWVPPQGAARSYTPDEDWQQHFSAYAAAAVVIVMDGSRSDNLYWELAEIVRKGWQNKFFFVTAPAPLRRYHAGFRFIRALQRSAKGIRRPPWNQFVTELNNVGLRMPVTEPPAGSVVAFDATGHAEVLISHAQQPEEFVTAIQARL